MRNPRFAITLLLLALSLGGCASNSTPLEPYDPYEQANRAVYDFNDGLDRYFLGPVASGYSAVTPHFFRRGVDNFFGNIGYPNTILNAFLQGKVGQGFQDTGRFLVNSTVGLLGVWDPASYMGMPKHDEDFGQTLAVWGANTGPFLELPLLGASHTREVSNIPVATATNPMTYLLSFNVTAPLTALYVVNKRALLDKAVKIREQAALDPYLFTRNAYMQYRENLIYDGNPPVQEDPYADLFDDEEGGAAAESAKPDVVAPAK